MEIYLDLCGKVVIRKGLGKIYVLYFKGIQCMFGEKVNVVVIFD